MRLKHTMIAFETLASRRSESLTAPTPWPTILIATTGSSIFCSALSKASSVPCASALTTRLSSLTSPSLARRASSSRVMRGAMSLSGLLSALLGELGERDLARRLLRTDDLEDVAGLRDLAHARDDHRAWRAARRSTLRPRSSASARDAAVDVAADEVVADLQRARLDQHRRDRAAAALEVGVDDRADRVAVGVGLQLEDVDGEHDRRQQVVDALAGARAESGRTRARRRSGASRCPARELRRGPGRGWRPPCRSC